MERVQMLQAIGVLWPTNDCHQMTFLATSSTTDNNFNYEFMSQTCLVAHTSSSLFSGKNLDRTQEGGGKSSLPNP